MYDLTWNITIGKYRLMLLDSVEITRSVEQLSDVATIVLPGSFFNKAIGIESQIKRGDPVFIDLGYDGTLQREFSGFVEAIHADDGSLSIKCEDGLFAYRVGLENKVLASITLQGLLDHIHKTVTGFKTSCDYTFTYDKFTIQDATAYDVLKKVQEETKANIYVKDDTLHIHPQYTEVFGNATYDFARNIEASDLKYRQESERTVQVIVESKGRDGKIVRAEAGTTGGEKITLKLGGVAAKASLQKVADETLLQHRYTGYEGSFDAWMLPFCDAGYKAVIRDADYEYKNGIYYVTKVVTTFSSAGGKRTIQLGKKLRDE